MQFRPAAFDHIREVPTGFPPGALSVTSRFPVRSLAEAGYYQWLDGLTCCHPGQRAGIRTQIKAFRTTGARLKAGTTRR